MHIKPQVGLHECLDREIHCERVSQKLYKTYLCCSIDSLIRRRVTQVLAVGRSATAVKLKVNGQRPRNQLAVVKGQDENESSNPQPNALCI